MERAKNCTTNQITLLSINVRENRNDKKINKTKTEKDGCSLGNRQCSLHGSIFSVYLSEELTTLTLVFIRFPIVVNPSNLLSPIHSNIYLRIHSIIHFDAHLFRQLHIDVVFA